MPSRPGRTDNKAWRTARNDAITAAQGMCQLCGYPLRPDAPARTPWATEVDHITPLYLGGEPYAPTNLRATHRRCNGTRPNPAFARPRANHTDTLPRLANP